MTTYTFQPTTANQQVDWSDPAVWIGDVVPDGPSAEVVVPVVTLSAGGTDISTISIASDESYSVDSVSLTSNDLVIDGALTVETDFAANANGQISVVGTLDAGTLKNDGSLGGAGQVTTTGVLTNNSEIDGNGLTLTLGGLVNDGTLEAQSGNLTVQAPSGFAQFSNGALTGGTYGTTGNGNLFLDVGGVITTDGGTISLDGAGAIDSFDSASSSYISIQSTLDLISAEGSLSLAGQSYDWETSLTVAGALSLSDSGALSAPELIVAPGGTVSGVESVTAPIVIDPGGTVSGSGTITAPIDNSGVILAEGTSDVSGAVNGDGTIEIAPEQLSLLRNYETSTLELGGPDSENVSFADSTGTLQLDDISAFGGTISLGGPGDKILLPGVSFDSVTGYSYAGTSTGGTLTIDAGGTAYTLKFAGDFATSSFSLSAGPPGLFTSSPRPLLITSGGPLTFSGIRGVQITTDQSSFTPFSSTYITEGHFPFPVPGVTVEDVGNPPMTLTVILSSAANGVLSNLDGGTYNVLTGVYTVSGTAAAVSTALDGLVFTPTISDAPLGSTKTTTFTIVVNDGIVPPVSDSTVAVAVSQALTPIVGNENSPDILWQNTNGQLSLWEMSDNNIIGGGPVSANPGASFHAIGTGDFFDDGNSEILLQNVDGQIALWETNGGGTVNLNPGLSWRVVGAGDFTDDGFSDDILFQNTSTGQASIWEMNGSNLIGGGPVSSNPGPAWQAIGTGDFNKDGHSDILWQNTGTGQVSIWEMNGNTLIGGGQVSPNPGPAWQAIGTGDFNQDGFSDILFQNKNTGQVSVWEMDGNALIGGGSVSANPGASWHAIGTGSGGSDILLQNTSTGQASIWEMNGNTITGGGPVSPNPGSSWRAAGLT